MPEALFSNATTRLPIDVALERDCRSRIKPAFTSALRNTMSDQHVVVQMVDRHDPNLDGSPTFGCDEIPDTDALGVYIPHTRGSHRPAMKVCPEKILDACQSLSGQGIAGRHSFKSLFSTLLSAVIVHEMAHRVMDPWSTKVDNCATTWQARAKWLDKNTRLLAKQRKGTWNSTWDDHPSPTADTSAFLFELDGQLDHLCAQLKSLSSDYPLAEARTIEESLANAIMLRQNWDDRQLRILQYFVSKQSKPYQLGMQWKGTLRELIFTASSWSKYKEGTIGYGGKRWKKASKARRGILEDLLRRLNEENGVRGSFDFDGHS